MSGGALRAPARAVTVLNACSAASCASMRASASSQTSTAGAVPAADGVAELPQRGCRAAHPMTRGTRNRRPSRIRVGRIGQRLGPVERRPHLVGAVDLVASDDARGGRHAGRVDLLHLVGVVEDIAELPREQIELLLVELEVRERGNRLDLGPCESAAWRDASIYDLTIWRFGDLPMR